MFESIQFDKAPTVVESVCTQCRQNGQTTMLLTSIPSFKEIILISFYCQACGNKNNQIQFGGKIASKGVQIRFKSESKADLDRQVIKSGFASITIPQIQLQIPPNNRGEISTIEGIVKAVISDLQQVQPLRKVEDPQNFEKIQLFLDKIRKLLETFQFQIILRDPSGNSFIKNPFAPKLDPRLKLTQFVRTKEEIQSMGYSHQNQDINNCSHKIDFTQPFDQSNLLQQQGIGFQTMCHACSLLGEVRMCQTSVPYFKDMIVMAFTCQYCGAHSSEVKTSGQIPLKGRKIEMHVEPQTYQKDMRRDLFKSDTCGVNIPELQLQLNYGTLGGVYTTVEGLLEKIHQHLSGVNQFFDSDSQFNIRIKRLFKELNDIRDGRLKKFTLILDDPAAHSFLQNPRHPQKDMNVRLQEYERNFQQNEDLGLNDMKA